MGATPTHQAETQDIDANIWGPKEGSGEEIVLPIPFRVANLDGQQAEEGMLRVEGGAVCTCHCKAKCAKCSPGSTALPSTPAMRGPWSRTTSIREEDLYPAEHLFIKTLKESDNLDETPFTATTLGYPLYKGSYIAKPLHEDTGRAAWVLCSASGPPRHGPCLLECGIPVAGPT